jgi:Zn-dependent M28 family amino/carboxypeptidase
LKLRSFILVFFTVQLCVSFINPPPLNKRNIDKFKEIVYTLSADSMLGRQAGTIGEERARKYITQYFNKIKLSSFRDSYSQIFNFPIDSINSSTAFNVIGYLNNRKDSTIIIGAHYDHIGLGGVKSRSLTDKKIHNGADDNASGVAMMLLLAEHLKNQKRNRYNYLFIAFSAHEDGLFGSQAFVHEKIYNLSRVKLMLNFDMVGRLDSVYSTLRVVREEKNNSLDSFLLKANSKINFKFTDVNKERSDASEFINKSIPALTFSTGIHDDYHRITDDADKINYEGMNELFEFFKKIISDI